MRCSRKQESRSQGVVCERDKLPTPGVWLEVDLSSELEDSRVKRRGHLAESAVAKIGVHCVQLGVIPGVERFQAQFQAAAASFAQRKTLEEGKVPVVAARSPQIVAWQGTPSAEGWKREGGWAEPFIDRMGRGERARQVWPVRAIRYAVVALSTADPNVNGQAGLHRDDAGDFPSSDSGLQEAAFAMPEQGDVVDEVDDSHVGTVVSARSDVVQPAGVRIRDVAEVATAVTASGRVDSA